MNKIGKGFKWAKREHVWEKRTNVAILIGIICIFSTYYFKIYPAECGIFFIIIIGIIHGTARFCHKMEQHYLKDMRHQKK